MNIFFYLQRKILEKRKQKNVDNYKKESIVTL